MREDALIPLPNALLDHDQKLTVRFPATMLGELRAVAKSDERSLNGEIVWLLRQQLLGRPSCDDTARTLLSKLLRVAIFAHDTMPDTLGAEFGELQVASWLADTSALLIATDDRVLPRGGR